MMSKKVWSAGLSLAVVVGYVASALAQAKPEVLIKQRQAVMTLQGKYFGPLAAMAQGKAPYNKDIVVRNAEYLSVLDKMPWDGFAESTKDEKSVKTAALPTIWKDSDKFKQAQENLQGEVSKLVHASKTGDEAAVKAQIGAVGKSCAACHQDFREKPQ
jgi:cytochrome c556